MIVHPGGNSLTEAWWVGFQWLGIHSHMHIIWSVQEQFWGPRRLSNQLIEKNPFKKKGRGRKRMTNVKTAPFLHSSCCLWSALLNGKLICTTFGQALSSSFHQTFKAQPYYSSFSGPSYLFIHKLDVCQWKYCDAFLMKQVQESNPKKL